MKVVLINKSDSVGGAAIVTFRLMEALRGIGVDARMLVAEKHTDSEYVGLAAPGYKLKYSFLKERARIYKANGYDRSTLFKIDTCSDGVPIGRHPWVREADIICLNWINQGLLSFKGIDELIALGKPLIWTMHDMWCMTGICHHAGDCTGYLSGNECGFCPLLGSRKSYGDISHIVWEKKRSLYHRGNIRFVAVSRWLGEKAKESNLLKDEKVDIIPNPIALMPGFMHSGNDGNVVNLVFGAARLDDSIKGWPILIGALNRLKEKNPQFAEKCRLTLFGNMKDEKLLSQIPVKYNYLGVVSPEDVPKIYSESDIVVSTSHYETLPGTLIEGQAYGCVPVAFLRGGQGDIIDHLQTGYLAAWSDDGDEAADNIAHGIEWAAEALKKDTSIRNRMKASVEDRFSPQVVAEKYLQLFNTCLHTNHSE